MFIEIPNTEPVCLCLGENIAISHERAVQLYDGVNKTNDAAIRSFQKYMVQARKILNHKVQCPERSITQSENCPQMVYLQKSEIKSYHQSSEFRHLCGFSFLIALNFDVDQTI